MDFSHESFLAELDNFGRPPPERRLCDERVEKSSSTSTVSTQEDDDVPSRDEIALRLHNLMLDKQKKLRGMDAPAAAAPQKVYTTKVTYSPKTETSLPSNTPITINTVTTVTTNKSALPSSPRSPRLTGFRVGGASVGGAQGGMATLAAHCRSPTEEKINKDEVNQWKQQVLSSTRPRNQWYEEQHISTDASREYAKLISDRSSSEAGSSLPSPTVNGRRQYSDRSESDGSEKSASPAAERVSATQTADSPEPLSPYRRPAEQMHFPSHAPDYIRPLTSAVVGQPHHSYVPVVKKKDEEKRKHSPTGKPHYFPPAKAWPPPNFSVPYKKEADKPATPTHPALIGSARTSRDWAPTHRDVSGSRARTQRAPTQPARVAESPRASSSYAASPVRADPRSTVSTPSYQEPFAKNPLAAKIPEYERQRQAKDQSAPRKQLKWAELGAELTNQEKEFGSLTEQLRRQALQEREEKRVVGRCAACENTLYSHDEISMALERRYHAACFACDQCGRGLRNRKFYPSPAGAALCQECFLLTEQHLAAERCARCNHPVVETVLKALGLAFHPACFRCTECEGQLDGKPFAVDPSDKQRPYCMPDFYERFAPRCHACAQTILPNESTGETIRVVAVGKDYHVDCYACEGCHIPLSDEAGRRCYPIDGHLLCHTCHQVWKRTGGASRPITDL